jgi:hypothetical protein
MYAAQISGLGGSPLLPNSRRRDAAICASKSSDIIASPPSHIYYQILLDKKIRLKFETDF